MLENKDVFYKFCLKIILRDCRWIHKNSEIPF
jgi:hypothetical protein